MQLLKNASKLLLGMIAEKPGSAAGLVVFGLGFALVAGNALYAQKNSHPDPIWSTEKQQDSLSDTQPKIAKVIDTNSITRSVLTQRISLNNVPVPTAKPTRNATVASHTSLVRDVQSILTDIGYYEGKIDGIYGSGTRAAINTFQKRAGIIPNGKASYGLLNQLQSVLAVAGNQRQVNEVKSPQVIAELPKAVNSKTNNFNAEMVAQIQFGLKENFGIENISVDGLMGNQTKSAIKKFQERFKLTPTGELDNLTIAKMRSVGILAVI